MESLKMYLGERRKITLTVSISDTSSFSVSNPTWELTGSEETLTGACTTDENKLSMEIEPTYSGYYILTVSFDVATERIKRKIQIVVL